MATLHVILDPTDRLQTPPDAQRALGLKIARLDIPHDLGGCDIYEIARKLAELLLEQVA